MVRRSRAAVRERPRDETARAMWRNTPRPTRLDEEMKYIDEYRDPAAAQRLLEAITDLAGQLCKDGRKLHFMEV